MKKKFISILKYLLFLLIGLGLLWFVTKDQNIDQIIKEFKNANYYWLLLSVLFGVISHLSRAMRWNILINSMGYKTKTSITFYAVIIGYFANYTIPRSGEIARCGVLNRTNKIPLNSLIGTVVSERIFDTICLLLIIVAVILFQLEFVGGFLNKYVLLPLISKFSCNIINVFCWVLALLGAVILIIFLIRKFSDKLKRMSFYSKLQNLWVGFADGIKTIKRIDKKGLFLFHTFFIWLMYLLMIYIPFFAMNATSHLRVIDGVTVLALGSLGIVAPVPGGIGAYHFIVKTTLVELFGINSDSATSFAYLVHTTQTLTIIVVGILSLIILFLLNRKKENGKS